MKLQWLRRLWGWLRTPSATASLGFLLAFGLISGVLATVGFNSFVAYSNTLDFCISCHEMRSFPHAEYQQSAHAKSRSGVHPSCPDCHVPRAFVPKMLRKIQATYIEVPRHFLGVLDTPEKYEAERLRMAESVWATMKATDSRECRACHDASAMNLDDQKPRARTQHADAATSGETCIDCHKGIAHRLPEMPEADKPATEEEDFNL